MHDTELIEKAHAVCHLGAFMAKVLMLMGGGEPRLC
jgi:hypothetical protein